MGTTLQHGIFLPAEGERNCYAGLASNWTILDGMIGGYSSHAANLTIHVTAADKEAWNGKADASALTAHTGNTTIHVTAEDKNKWDAVTGKADSSALTAHTGNTTIHVTAEDKNKWDAVTGKADDTAAVHKSGAETIPGAKTFSNMSSFQGSYLGNESSTNERTNLYLIANRDTVDKSGAYISRFRPNKNQGGLSTTDNSFISISFLENETRYTRCFDFGLTDWDSDGIPQTYYFTSPGGKGALGTSSKKWQTINGIEPSSLSLPSGNTSDRVDISSYITAFDGTTNSYTPPANGWISISANNCTEIYVFLNNLWGVNNSKPAAGNISVMLPVIKDMVIGIRVTGGTLNFARFIPCQGNV